MRIRPHAFVRFGIALVALIGAGCAAAPINKPIKGGPVDTGRGSVEAARQYLEGRWTLLSYEVRSPGRDPILLNGTGMLLYDAFGNLSIEIRVDEPSAKLLEDAGISSTAGAISMSGRTAVDMKARTLAYVLEGQPPLGAPSGPLALNRLRYWEVEGNILTLTTRGDDGQPLAIGRWRKAD